MASIEFDQELHMPQNESRASNLITAVAILGAIWLLSIFTPEPVQITPDFHGNSGSLALVK